MPEQGWTERIVIVAHYVLRRPGAATQPAHLLSGPPLRRCQVELCVRHYAELRFDKVEQRAECSLGCRQAVVWERCSNAHPSCRFSLCLEDMKRARPTARPREQLKEKTTHQMETLRCPPKLVTVEGNINPNGELDIPVHALTHLDHQVQSAPAFHLM